LDHFRYRDDQLWAEEVACRAIAETVGTPCYVYSRATIEQHWRAFEQALRSHPHSICYAVKANSSLAVLQIMARLGSGFDIVSGGELERVLRAGGAPEQIIFSGVGKTAAEIKRALEVGIHCLNIESEEELNRVIEISGVMGIRAPVALRVNPDVDPKTHPYIATGLKENKFGVPAESALALYQRAARHTRVLGIACHIGSQLTSLSPFVDALERMLELVDALAAQGISLQHLDMGGGLGIRYQQENPPVPDDLARVLLERLSTRYPQLALHIEPGRAIVGNAGILMTRVEYLKPGEPRNFAIVDAAMNDLIRPALYQAWQEIIPLDRGSKQTAQAYDIVGPVCETGDKLGSDRLLAISPGDVLAIRSAGAYGMTMSSNYNTRPRVPEVLVDGQAFHIIRRRETIDDLLSPECLL